MLVRYGYAAGAAGALCAAIGFALDLEHVGWAPAAALLVIRPVPATQRLRSLDRVLDVVVGATAAIALTTLGAPDWVFSLVVLAGVAAATATAGSRWYLLPTLTTFLAFVMLLYDDPEAARRGSGSGCWRPRSGSARPRSSGCCSRRSSIGTTSAGARRA